MKLPPEFNSWDEVWEEHQRRGQMIRNFQQQLRESEESHAKTAKILADTNSRNGFMEIRLAAMDEIIKATVRNNQRKCYEIYPAAINGIKDTRLRNIAARILTTEVPP